MAGNDVDRADAVRECVFAAVRSVPSGRVATYGQIADFVRGASVTARQVGGALCYAPSDVPWHRVVGAGGHLPIGKRSHDLMVLQRRLLAAEGVKFVGERNVVDLASARFDSSDPRGQLG
jgi:methylated-DNA-protein-cysteine methyltransferase related protein